ncbi:hypothetical protein AB4344_11715 [Vibrio breoganii]
MKKITILTLFPDASQVQERPMMLLSACSPQGKPPQTLCAVLANGANSMKKPMLSIDEAQRTVTFSYNGFNEQWRLCGMVFEISLDRMRLGVSGLWALEAVQSRRQSVQHK